MKERVYLQSKNAETTHVIGMTICCKMAAVAEMYMYPA